MILYKYDEEEDKYINVSLKDVIEYFLEMYEGIEHMAYNGKTTPEIWYTVTTILRRCLNKIKDN